MLTSGSGFTRAISTLRNPRVLEAGGEAPQDASEPRRWGPHSNPSGKVSAEPRAHVVRHRARFVEDVNAFSNGLATNASSAGNQAVIQASVPWTWARSDLATAAGVRDARCSTCGPSRLRRPGLERETGPPRWKSRKVPESFRQRIGQSTPTTTQDIGDYEYTEVGTTTTSRLPSVLHPR